MQPLTFAAPGLLVYPDYFSAAACADILAASLAVFARLEAVAGPADESARVPQPEFVRSERHNLASEESFTRVSLPEPGGRVARCEYFPRYGEEGHALAYFRGNDRLPTFAVGLLDGVRRTVEAAGLAAPDRELTWKLTMNFYRAVAGTVAGFPFHVDIPANGVVTMILNVQRAALFQIARDEQTIDVPLPVGALLVLSGESRYEWKHRVLPMPAEGTGGIERVSLVLGYQ